MRFEIGKKQSGLLVREFLSSHLELSHRAISALKNSENGIVLNGTRVTVRATLSDGDILELELENKPCDGDAVIPADIPIEVLYEDQALTVVNKPPFMPTIISHGHYDDTLANALAYRYRDRDFVMRAVNRLDRDTSGICLIANSRRSAHILGEQMRARGMEKKYLAVLSGNLENDLCEKEIVTGIRRKEGSVMLREVADISVAREARTLYRLISNGKRFCAVSAEPKTGRTHQLRVHFAHIGHPIVGDTLYSQRSDEIARQALHAYELTLTHPYTKEKMTFRAPIASDIASLASFDALDLSKL
ncbi:MAG: RluA family pseudouridine synthase [Ruminococcaceae bacterium]|nr:RluA family pseudouridine synthase [Oscillospiraceae bacterium]